MVVQVRDAIYDKFDGHPPDGGSYTDFGVVMDPDDELIDPDTTWEEHFLGSFDGNAHIRDERIYYTIENESDVHSLLGGRFIDDLNERNGWNLWTAPEYTRDQFPMGGQTKQTITWSEPVVPRSAEEMKEQRKRKAQKEREAEEEWWEIWR